MQDPDTVFPLFRISYHWIAPLGLLATLTVGAVVGWFFDNRKDIKLDAELFTPVIWKTLPSEALERAGETRRNIAIRNRDIPAPSSPLILGHVTTKVS